MGFGISLVIGLWLIHKGTRQITSTLWVPRVFGLPSLREDTSFGLLVFTPKQLKFFMEPRLPKSYADSSSGYWPSPQSNHGCTWKWLCLGFMKFYLALGTDWPLKKEWASKWTMVHQSVYASSFWRRGESSVRSKHECLNEVSTGHRSCVALHPLTSLHRY